jgi:hypothetical protein
MPVWSKTFEVMGKRVWVGRSKGFFHLTPSVWVQSSVFAKTVNAQFGNYYIEVYL